MPHPSSQFAQPPVLTGQRIVIRVDKNGKTSKELRAVSSNNQALKPSISIQPPPIGNNTLKSPITVKIPATDNSILKSITTYESSVIVESSIADSAIKPSELSKVSCQESEEKCSNDMVTVTATIDNNDTIAKTMTGSALNQTGNDETTELSSEIKSEDLRSIETTDECRVDTSANRDQQNLITATTSEQNESKDEVKEGSSTKLTRTHIPATSATAIPRILTIPSSAIGKTITVDSKPTRIVTFLRTPGKIICSKPMLQQPINANSNTLTKYPLIQVTSQQNEKPLRTVIKVSKPKSSQSLLPGVLTTDIQQFANALASDSCALVSPQKACMSPRSTGVEPKVGVSAYVPESSESKSETDFNNNDQHNFESNELVNIAPEDQNDTSFVDVVDYSNESSPLQKVNHFQVQNFESQVKGSREISPSIVDLSNGLNKEQDVVLYTINKAEKSGAENVKESMNYMHESHVDTQNINVSNSFQSISEYDTVLSNYTGTDSDDTEKQEYVTSTEEYGNCLQGMQQVIDNIPIGEPLNLSKTAVENAMSPNYSTSALDAGATGQKNYLSVNSTSNHPVISPVIPINYDSVSLLTNPSLITSVQQSPSSLPSNHAALDFSSSMTHCGSPQNALQTVSMTSFGPALNLYQSSALSSAGQSSDWANSELARGLYQNHPVGMMGINDSSFERPQYLARLTATTANESQKRSDIWGARNITKKRSKRKLKSRSESD